MQFITLSRKSFWALVPFVVLGWVLGAAGSAGAAVAVIALGLVLCPFANLIDFEPPTTARNRTRPPSVNALQRAENRRIRRGIPVDPDLARLNLAHARAAVEAGTPGPGQEYQVANADLDAAEAAAYAAADNGDRTAVDAAMENLDRAAAAFVVAKEQVRNFQYHSRPRQQL